jgi:aminoglycoside phosphotransferase (APT) family kinase protein
LGDKTHVEIERAGDGISTAVYRLQRGEEVFYLRVLPEIGQSFAPEAYVHTLLCGLGVHVPEVVYFEHYNEGLQRSVMVTSEISGRHLGWLATGPETSEILRQAGRELAIINAVPVEGFGWIKRDSESVSGLEAEGSSHREFLLEDLDSHLSVLGKTALTAHEVAAVREAVRLRSSRLEVEQGQLAHGDFDLTHIYQEGGRYTGIIDFGEIRGTGRYYDLGHFRLHDGEIAPYEALPFLLAGYQEAAPLPHDHESQIALVSLLVGVRFMARDLQRLMARKIPPQVQLRVCDSIRRDLGVLARNA